MMGKGQSAANCRSYCWAGEANTTMTKLLRVRQVKFGFFCRFQGRLCFPTLCGEAPRSSSSEFPAQGKGNCAELDLKTFSVPFESAG